VCSAGVLLRAPRQMWHHLPFFAVMLLLLPSTGQALPLIRKSRDVSTPPPLSMSSELVVAVASDAPSQERWAAQQLAQWLGAMPGASRNCSKGWPHCAPTLVAPSGVVLLDGKPRPPTIFVGAGAAQAAGEPHAELHHLGRVREKQHPTASYCSRSVRSHVAWVTVSLAGGVPVPLHCRRERGAGADGRTQPNGRARATRDY
jgi:hypothetical protein